MATHDSHGWWLRDAGLSEVVPEPALSGRTDAEVVVVGGGYTGMWTAWFISEMIDPESVVLLEASICGTGPSGRNGGFCQGLSDQAPYFERAFGADAARALIERTEELAHAVGDWSDRQGIDIHFRPAGELTVMCAPGQDSGWTDLLGSCRRIGLGKEYVELDRSQVRSRCDSPLFGRGLFTRDLATVHPGRLALGLRKALIERGVRVHECSPVRSLEGRPGRAVARSTNGTVAARSGVIACGVSSSSWRGVRNELTMTSSHMVITEPVPDVLEQIGWTGGEAIIDGRTLVHYFRTTRDDRIAFGWGGGRIGRGVAPGCREEVDRPLVARVEKDLLGFFPQLEGRSIEYAWGGPIDASPRHLPAIRPLSNGSWDAAFGYTGNGVGPSRSCGLVLAQRALDRECDPGPLAPLIVDRPQKVPPEPFRWLGGSVIMRAIDSVERQRLAGGEGGPIARAVASIPDRLGYSLGR